MDTPSPGRVQAYLSTAWAIHTATDPNQHSLLTWFTWLGANLTVAAWLYEQNGRRVNRCVVVNLSNATICLAASALILCHRV